MAKFMNIMLAAAVVTTGLAVPAAAQEDDRVRAVVRYDDLNLSSAVGRERLQTRVKMAVRRVCGTRIAQDLRAQQKAHHCERVAMRDADVKLADLFNGHGTALANRGQVIVAAP